MADTGEIENPYAPPSAPLSGPQAPSELRERRILLMILLTVVTLSVYLIYWLVVTTRTLNARVPTARISTPFMALCVLMTVANLGLAFYADVLLSLIWALRLRHSINTLTGAPKPSLLWVNLFWTWIFQHFYLQLQINRILRAEVSAHGG